MRRKGNNASDKQLMIGHELRTAQLHVHSHYFMQIEFQYLDKSSLLLPTHPNPSRCSPVLDYQSYYVGSKAFLIQQGFCQDNQAVVRS